MDKIKAIVGERIQLDDGKGEESVPKEKRGTWIRTIDRKSLTVRLNGKPAVLADLGNGDEVKLSKTTLPDTGEEVVSGIEATRKSLKEAERKGKVHKAFPPAGREREGGDHPERNLVPAGSEAARTPAGKQVKDQTGRQVDPPRRGGPDLASLPDQGFKHQPDPGEEEEDEGEDDAGEGDEIDEALEERTVPELRETAEAEGVDLSGVHLKADIIKAIEKNRRKG